jgi:uncharacterized membrane protein
MYFIMIVNLLPLVPFLLFILFCPPTHKRVRISRANRHLRDEELGLLYLKNKFESGEFTQQEYEHKRKALLDKLYASCNEKARRGRNRPRRAFLRR